MKIRYGYWVYPLLAISFFALAACAPPAQPEPAAIPAEVEAMVPAEPTPLPADVRMVVNDFAAELELIDGEWGQLRAEFDEWNAGLTACLPNSMRTALNDFAIGFNDITVQARDVTRTQTTGELADLLIAAAEEEEASYRQLRDRWQPNNVSLFEQVEEKRAEASQAQAEAQDRAIELQETFEDAPDAETIDEFTEAFDAVKSDWGALHDEYTELREEADSLEVEEVLDGLDEIVKKSSEVIDALDELPPLDGTENVVDDLLSAAKAERKALRAAAKRPTSSSKSGSPSGSSASTATDSNGTAEASNGGNGSTGGSSSTDASQTETTEVLELPDFTDLDESVETSETAIKLASRVVRSIADVDVEKNLAELRRFNVEYGRLTSEWEDFHDEYNAWRRAEGGCDRAAVVGRLDEFSNRASSLSNDVQALPQSGVLLPMYSLLVDAAAEEENAMRTLRYTWQPFAIDSFKAVHEQRNLTDDRRRQAGIAIQELQNRP